MFRSVPTQGAVCSVLISQHPRRIPCITISSRSPCAAGKRVSYGGRRSRGTFFAGDVYPGQ